VADPLIRADEELKEAVVEAFIKAMEQQGVDDYEYVPNMLAIAPPFVKEDRSCVLSAVIQNGHALQFVADIWKWDPEVVWMAVNETNDKAARDRSRHCLLGLLVKPELAHLAQRGPVTVCDMDLSFKTKFFAADILQPPKTKDYTSRDSYNTRFQFADQITAFQFAAEPLKRNKQFVIAVVSRNGNALQYVADVLKRDRQVVLTAVKRNRDSVKYALPFVADREFLLQLLACVGDHANASEFGEELVEESSTIQWQLLDVRHARPMC